VVCAHMEPEARSTVAFDGLGAYVVPHATLSAAVRLGPHYDKLIERNKHMLFLMLAYRVVREDLAIAWQGLLSN